MKTYHDIAGDGGSDVLGQVIALKERMEERLSRVRHVVAIMSGKTRGEMSRGENG